MPDTLQSVLIAGGAGIVSGIITHFSTRAKVRLDLAAVYDKELQDSRLKEYKLLWAKLEPIAKYGRHGPLTTTQVQVVSTDTRVWYFQSGGIYLTERSRGPYFAMKKAIDLVIAPPPNATPAELQAALLSVIDTGSALRTALSDDIGTKRMSRV